MGVMDFIAGLARGMLFEKNKDYIFSLYRGEIDRKVFHRDFLTLSGYRVYYEDYLYIVDLYREVFKEKLYDFETDHASPLIFDLGANIGMAALRFKKLYPAAKLVCFEPQAKAFDLLSRNIRENYLDGVALYNLAVGDRDGDITFYSDPSTGSCPGAGAIRMDGFVESRVRCVRVSSYIDERVDLLKLDVEGSELMVVSDLAATGKLDRVDRVFLEYHAGANCLDELTGMLRDHGFRWRIGAPDHVKPEGKQEVCMIYATR